MGEAAEKRQGEEKVPFLLIVDCEAALDDSGMIPFAVVIEEIRQALARTHGVEPKMVHASIRESREEILHAVVAVGDEEDRQRHAPQGDGHE